MKKIYLGILLLVAHVQLTLAQVYTTDQLNALGSWDSFSSFSTQANPFKGIDGDKEKEYELNGISWTNGDKLKAFTIFSPQATNPPMAERWLKPRSGNNLLLFSCNFDTDADNWIISPKVRLERGSPKLEFYIQNYHEYWQRYQIWVSTTTNDINSFTKISDGEYIEASGKHPTTSSLGWKRISFDLSAYANQDIYVAIHHVTPTEGIMMAIDDLKIVYEQENVLLPIVDFVADKTEIPSDQSITFTDQSKNSPTSWKWSFAGGTPATSTSKNPTVAYEHPGVYNVKLIAINANGSATKVKSGYITVTSNLKSDFSANKIEAFEGEKIIFRDFSLGEPTAWEWSFTGANTPNSTQQNPEISYPNAGTYNVTLKVSKGANQNTKTKTGYVVIKPAATPVVDFSANKTVVEEGDKVRFKDATTGGGLNYSWTFEGASPPVSNEINPEVTYYNEGSYKVTLKVSNAKGEDILTKENYITVSQVEVDYCDANSGGSGGTRGIANVKIGAINNTTAAGSYTYYSNLQTIVERNESYPITITTSSAGFAVDENGRGNKVAIWVDWNQNGSFRDEGEKMAVINSTGGATFTSTIKVPADALRRKSRMRVRSFFSFKNGDEDPCGESPEGEVEDYNLYINSPDIKPVADFKSNTQSAPGGSFINFSDNSQNTITGWEWNFEGGTPSLSYDKNPQIRYTTPGTYRVTLKVTNSAGSDTKIKENYVTITQGDDPGPTCNDGIQNGDETGIDCGGSCKPCDPDPTCNDGIQNGDETGVDCGGSCKPCAVPVEGATVSTSDDQTAITTITGDGIADVISFKNTSESIATYAYLITDEAGKILATETTSHDFEGATEGICKVYGISYNGNLSVTGKSITDRDLATASYDVSDNFITVTRKDPDPDPTCDDGIKNGDETGVDCGGRSCPACPTLIYCDANSTNDSDEYISRFQLGSIDNASTSNGGYSDFTNISTGLSKNNNHKFTITPTWSGTVYSEAYGIWIDYNQDGDFEDSGEQVFSKTASKDTSITGQFTVPSDAKDGATRLRVIMRYSTAPSPCGTFNYGEAEDYTVNIGGVVNPDPTCTDGIQNGDETGIDCGGVTCSPCVPTNTGEVVYVDIQDQTVSATNTWTPFQIEIGDSRYFGPWLSGNILRLVTYDKDVVCEANSSNITLLPDGVKVDASSNFVTNANSFVVSSSDYPNWNGKSGYIGFNFKVSTRTHYGWFYATVSSDGTSYTILDYAYNKEPEQGLVTTRNFTKSVDKYKRSIFTPNPFKDTATLDVSGLGKENFTLSVYDVLGKEVYSKTYAENPGKITLGEDQIRRVGVYYIRIVTKNISEYHSVIKK
ncbi:GEVED domain-containing protein [Aquimarina sp. 2201CG1-2-11]|uniref:GEVED domain-containing protein n=1 Tax=Aquimarina discodermiae TaxID=3231043 RepID=UPI003462DE5E